MKYCSFDLFGDFEFHYAVFTLRQFRDRDLTLSADYVNIRASAEQNPHGRDTELGTAVITLRGFRVISCAAGGANVLNEKGEVIAEEPQTVLVGADAERLLLDNLRPGVRVYEFGIHEEDGCYLDGCGIDPWFHARLAFDAAEIQWDGWNGPAWYEKRS